MADFKEAIVNTLRWEDAKLSGKVKYDAGGLTKWGLAKRYNPEVTAETSLEQAIEIYKRKYWIPKLTQLFSQPLANKIFDMCVNPGIGAAIVMVQCALNDCGNMLHEDGIFGQGTADACNVTSDEAVLAILRKRLVQYYEAKVEHEPHKAIYLKGWLRRAAS